jgi:hypothetical protein
VEVQKIPQMRVQEIHQQPSWKILGTHYAVLVEKAGHFLVKVGHFRKKPCFFIFGHVLFD